MMDTDKKKKDKQPDKLNLGCGLRKIPGWLNMDSREEVKPDIVHDIASDGLPFKDNSISEIRAFDFLEHVPMERVIFVMEEIHRVLKPDGILEHFTPSTDGRGAFQDPMHRSFWNINSWLYYMDDAYRNLYRIKAKFKGRNIDVVSDNAGNVRHTHGKLIAVKK